MQKYIKRYFFIFLFPTITAFIVAFIIPFIMGIYLSFCRFTTIQDAYFIGFNNYILAFSYDNSFINALWFTTKFTVVSIVSINIFAFIMAILLTKGLKGTNFFRSVFFMPNLIGGIVLGYIWQLIINGLLGFFGVDITYDASYGFFGLVVLMNWQMIGYMMIIYIAGLQNVPRDLLEAAEIDGCSKMRTLFNVTIPMVMPSITICTFLTLSNSFKLFDQNLALTGGAPQRQTMMLALDIYDTFYGRNGFEGVGQAKAVIFFLMIATIGLLQLKVTRSKEVEN